MLYWEDWFKDKKGRAPSFAEIAESALNGPTQGIRDEASRALARNITSVGGGIAEIQLPIDIITDYRPANTFFLELEKVASKPSLERFEPYRKWVNAVGNERHKYAEIDKKMRHILAVNTAIKNRPKAVERIKALTNQWNTLFFSGKMSTGVNYSFAGKFMEELRKDASLGRYIPDALKYGLGRPVARPFYEEVRNYQLKNQEIVESILNHPDDFRKEGLSKLLADAERDDQFRRYPAKGKAYFDRMIKQKESLIAAQKELDERSERVRKALKESGIDLDNR